eukprot:CAMPEP_0179222804 /NCGR_PEP_ID=MMETSP0797-20121207/6906_1 /TAXON_ID=47934 /ORGANISM="Dinophysis acuminata, Strain DAEP01" /LENGTH=73 /DNA_ID=CAMNT_0020929651 /DNA_START=168 /DNA_END=386 /DNA_ORIENTATION=-
MGWRLCGRCKEKRTTASWSASCSISPGASPERVGLSAWWCLSGMRVLELDDGAAAPLLRRSSSVAPPEMLALA